MQPMSNPVQINTKALVFALLGGGLAVYVIWSIIPPRSKLKVHMSWKHKKFVDIPEVIEKAASETEITSRNLKFNIKKKEVNVHYLEVNPAKKKKTPVLLLHGQAFSSATWKEIGTLQRLGSMGYRSIAIDLPGYGSSPAVDVDKVEFLKEFIAREHIERPVIVSPSMSGSWSLPYLLQTPHSCHDRARGFVPVAPVDTHRYSDRQYHQCEIPVMIVYGTKDEKLGLHSTGDLRNMANNEIFPIQGAKHACYMNNPEEWHKLLYNFLDVVEKDDDGSYGVI